VAVLAQVAQDAGLLDLLLEALEGAFEVLILVDDDLGHSGAAVGGWGSLVS